MIKAVPHYQEVVSTLADIVENTKEGIQKENLLRRAQTIIESAGMQPTQVATWLPVIKVPYEEWYFLVNERAVGVSYGPLLLVNVAEVLGIYRAATNDSAVKALTAILNVKEFEWAILEGE